MDHTRCRWATVAGFLSCALGPALGLGLAVHDLAHHGAAPTHDHTAQHGVAQAAEAILHGHLHEEDRDAHGHQIVPSSIVPSRLPEGTPLVALEVTASGASSLADGSWARSGPRAQLAAVAPISHCHVCVLRL